MNARDSLAADRVAEQAWERTQRVLDDPSEANDLEMLCLIGNAIAAELRAARVYANYLEGREQSRTSEKRTIEPTGGKLRQG